MYELIQVADHTYYMDCPTKVGFYEIGDGEVVLIDGGSDKDAGRKVKKILDSKGWKLKAIYNTHSHADHIGGNQYLQKQTGCKIYAPGMEACVANFPAFEPMMLYGGYPFKELENKFLMAKESQVEQLTKEVLPAGMEMIALPGHCYEMVGFRTGDDVVFLADCLSSEETLKKYQLGYIYDIASYLATLRMVKDLSAKAFVPAHAAVTEDISSLAQINIDKTEEIVRNITGMLQAPMTFEGLLTEIFSFYGLVMNLNQYVLIGSTVRSYLSYLKTCGLVSYEFMDNRMIWKAVSSEKTEKC